MATQDNDKNAALITFSIKQTKPLSIKSITDSIVFHCSENSTHYNVETNIKEENSLIEAGNYL